ncbi:MAG: TonB-dependent receptor [Acidobacteria bacterium]|nr:MAG: TonB-dependent receptor [Acidobacteriota bacterium]
MARKLGLIAVLLALVCAFAPRTAFAQIQSGSILVKVTDQQGGVIPGATVSITSPVLPAPLTGVTDSSGVYRFPSLTVGSYSLRVTLQGFKTSVRDGLQVIQGQTVSIDAELTVGGMTEETTVKGEPPVVDTKSANVKVNIDKGLLENTPGGKDIWSILQSKAPGIVFDAPDVGGNQAGLQRAFTSRGTPNAQNTQMLNGVNVNDPSAQGFSMNYYDPSSFENIQVSSGAQDISVGTAGVFINMVTKSGTNRFNGQALFTCQGDCKFTKTQAHNVDATLLKAGFRSDSNSVGYITNTNFQAGGPMVKNKLFFFASVNYQPTHVNVPGFPAVSPLLPITLSTSPGKDIQDTTDITTGTAKFNYQLNARNRFEGFIERQKYDKPNRGASASNTPDSNFKELDYGNTFQGGWNLLLTNRMFVDTKVSYNNIHFPLFQKTDLQSILDNTTGIRYRNSATDSRFYRQRLQMSSNWQYFVPEMFGGRHEFKGGVDFGHTPAATDNLRVDDVNLVYTSSNNRASTVQLFNSPTHTVATVNSLALYAQDSYSFRRLTVVGGIRWERVEGFLPEQTSPSSRYFPEGHVFNSVSIGGVLQSYTVKKNFSAVHNNPLWYNVAPRFMATYDLQGNGKTVLKGSWGRYLDQINTGTPPNANGTISQTYSWNDANGDFVFQPGTLTWNGTNYVGGELGALTNTNIPNPAAFDTSLKRPKRHEFTVGIDREVVPTVLASATYIWRKEKDVQTTVEQNFDQWDTLFTKVTVTDPGRDGVAGTSDDAPLTVYNQNAGVTLTNKVINDDRLAQRYNGLEFTLNRRLQDKWGVLLGYTYSRTQQDLVSLRNPNDARVNADGESGGRRHNFKVAGSYELPYQVMLGVNLTMQSGLPITRTWNIPACSSSILTNCLRTAQTVNAEKRGADTLDRLTLLDARFSRYFKIGTNRIDLGVDLYNLFNANTTYSVRTGTGQTGVREAGLAANPVTNIPTYRSPTGVLGPRILRFNITYSFSQK